MKKGRLLYSLLIIFLFVVSLVPRIYKLQSTEIYPDEITWLVRSRESFLALKTGNLNYFKNGWWKRPNDTEAINLPTAIISGASVFFLAKDQPTHYSLNIFPDYIAARIAIAAINSLFIVVFFLIVKKIINSYPIAVLGALMLSLDPTYLALSRWFLPDSFLAIWIFLSMSSYFFIKKNLPSVILSSLFLTLAFLTKPTAILVLIPFLLFSPLKFVFTLPTFAVFTQFLWLGQEGYFGWKIIEYLLRQFRLAQEPFTTFFNGKVTTNPPFYYYIYQLITRLPLLPLAALAILPFNLKIKQKILSKKLLINIVLFLLIYVLAFSLSTKKLGIRYIFVIFPWIYFFAGISIVAIVKKSKLIYKILLSFVFIAYYAGLTIYFFPNYYLYYNLLANGPFKAQKYDLVGLCMGAKDSIHFLERRYPEIKSVAYLGCNKTVIPYYSSIKVSTDWKNEKYVIVEESFRTLTPDNEAVGYYKTKSPIWINCSKGIILSRIYINK